MLQNDLKNRKCVPCDPPAGEAGGGVKPLTSDEYGAYLRNELPGWVDVADPSSGSGQGKKIEKEYKFKNFKEALQFVNKVGELAESEGHHPDINLYNFKNVKIILWTHAIGGLSENDFILASKIETIL
jgi:4a-hydroxytetrahydrobiopterin dehydratase